jgi:hypothetical protein
VYTFIETPTFVAEADKLWKEGERLEFFEWLASNPEIGDVIPGSGGCRKVRWSRGIWQAWWSTGHLLLAARVRRNLAASCLLQVCSRQHPWSSAQSST